MKLENVDLLSLQTSSMKQDPTTKALCTALTPHFKKVAEEAKLCLIYNRVNELDSAALDELAWQMHVDWYDATLDVDKKRQLIKTAVEVHQYRGTPYAVEEVIKTYFGDGYVQEWFEYGGAPFMFKVISANPSVNGEQTEQFLKVLNSVKNVRSHLEGIVITLVGEMDSYFAGIVHTGDKLEIRQVVE